MNATVIFTPSNLKKLRFQTTLNELDKVITPLVSLSDFQLENCTFPLVFSLCGGVMLLLSRSFHVTIKDGLLHRFLAACMKHLNLVYISTHGDVRVRAH